MRVYVFGAGKVGKGLARAARSVPGKRIHVTVRPARRGLPARPIDADLLILAVRDRDVGPTAATLASRGLVSKRTACVHVSGALDEGPLAPLRAVSAGVAQMHPMISFASLARAPSLAGGHVQVRGDARAVRKASAFVRLLGMRPRALPAVDPVGYHAAAGLVANGAAALAALGVELLARSGVPRDVAPAMLGPLLHSVAENVETLGFPDALTGPVRRGDRVAVERHLATLRVTLPEAVPLYLASALAQLPLARALGEAPAADFDALGTCLAEWLTATRRRR